MTKEDKRDRRAARKQAEDHFRPILRRRMGMYATNRQIEAAVKTVVNAYFSAQVRAA